MQLHPSAVPGPTEPGPVPHLLFPWDYWEAEARQRGLSKNLASLGRAGMREADQHAWSAPLTSLCQPPVLDSLLFRAPKFGRQLYRLLLESDGLRVVFDEANGELIELDGFRY